MYGVINPDIQVKFCLASILFFYNNCRCERNVGKWPSPWVPFFSCLCLLIDQLPAGQPAHWTLFCWPVCALSCCIAGSWICSSQDAISGSTKHLWWFSQTSVKILVNWPFRTAAWELDVFLRWPTVMGLSPHLYILYRSTYFTLSISSGKVPYLVHGGYTLQSYTGPSSQKNEPAWIH